MLLFLLIAFAALFFLLLPILVIVGSKRVSKSEKLGWILAVIFISWFAWIFFLLLAPESKKINKLI
jgi:hypothetical membrane protein